MNNSSEKNNLTKIKQDLENLKNSNKTMILATKTNSNDSEASYSPYICVDNAYYIIISKIASHYNNIYENKFFQGMIIEDESKAINTFFRKRAMLNFEFEEISTNNENIRNIFLDIHGKLINKVLDMDFDIFKLKLKNGKVILGPGQAFNFDNTEAILNQLTGDGHVGH